MRAYRSSLLLAVLAFVVMAAGCSQMSVRHLDRTPWATGEGKTLQLKFWRFEYAVEPREDGYRVHGEAYPVKETMPDWVDWIDELRMVAYISDASGKVLADDEYDVLPGPLRADRGVPVEFSLEADDAGDAPLFLTFGYRMALGKGKSSGVAIPPDRPLFFANERAVKVF